MDVAMCRGHVAMCRGDGSEASGDVSRCEQDEKAAVAKAAVAPARKQARCQLGENTRTGAGRGEGLFKPSITNGFKRYLVSTSSRCGLPP